MRSPFVVPIMPQRFCERFLKQLSFARVHMRLNRLYPRNRINLPLLLLLSSLFKRFVSALA
jgi:hypothetical protein